MCLRDNEGLRRYMGHCVCLCVPVPAARCYAASMKALEGIFEAQEGGEADEVPEEVRREALALAVNCGNNMAATQLKLGAPKQAEEACVSVLEMDPNNVKALYRAGFATMQQHRFDEAKMAFNRALEIDPGNKAVVKGLIELKAQVQAYKSKEAKIAQKMSQKLLGGGVGLRSSPNGGGKGNDRPAPERQREEEEKKTGKGEDDNQGTVAEGPSRDSRTPEETESAATTAATVKQGGWMLSPGLLLVLSAILIGVLAVLTAMDFGISSTDGVGSSTSRGEEITAAAVEAATTTTATTASGWQSGAGGGGVEGGEEDMDEF